MSKKIKPFHHSITARYSEVDQQGVVFNSHYLAYIDDAMDTWVRQFSDLRQRFNWDMMNKKCSIEWYGSIKSGDILDIYVVVTHWGRTSWRLGYIGVCKGQQIFTAEIVYISVRLGNNEPIDTPIGVRKTLGEAVDIKNFMNSILKTNDRDKLEI